MDDFVTLCGNYFTFVYFQVYVEYVVKNPVCDMSQPIESEIFKTKLDEYIRALPVFATRVS